MAGWVRTRIHPEGSVVKVDVLAVDSGFQRRRDRPSRQARLGGEQPFAVEFFKLSYFLLELVMLVTALQFVGQKRWVNYDS